jgi:hypothetical protein
MKGRTPEEVPMNLAEGIAQQLQRVVRACPEQHSAALFKDYTNVYSEILTARELCHPITKEMYTKANATFISQLKRLLNSYTSESIFGHSTVKDHKAADPNPSLPKVQQLTKENPKPAPATPCATSVRLESVGVCGAVQCSVLDHMCHSLQCALERLTAGLEKKAVIALNMSSYVQTMQCRCMHGGLIDLTMHSHMCATVSTHGLDMTHGIRHSQVAVGNCPAATDL